MQTIWIIIVLVWIVIPLVAKKKKQQAQQQAARERAARQRAAEAAAQQKAATTQPMRTAPLAPTVHTTDFQPPAFEGTPSQEGTGSSEGVGSAEEGTAKHTIASKLRELNQSPQHVVSVSSISGHAHQETSMTGIRPDCPPDSVPAVTAVTSVATEGAFVWNQTQALNGIVLSEILGPCLAMRD